MLLAQKMLIQLSLLVLKFLKIQVAVILVNYWNQLVSLSLVRSLITIPSLKTSQIWKVVITTFRLAWPWMKLLRHFRKKEVINLRSHLLVRSWSKKDTPLIKLLRQLKLIPQRKKAKKHQLDLRQKISWSWWRMMLSLLRWKRSTQPCWPTFRILRMLSMS